jgi:hypothetical protein
MSCLARLGPASPCLEDPVHRLLDGRCSSKAIMWLRSCIAVIKATARALFSLLSLSLVGVNLKSRNLFKFLAV